MTVVIALHYQNEVLHADGKIRVGVEADSPERQRIIRAAADLLARARASQTPIVHVRVAYRPDYADLITNAPILKGVKQLQAMQEGSWGAQFLTELAPLADHPNEFIVTHNRINAFYASPLEVVLNQLAPQRLIIAGVATHSVVESTVRHAVDMGYEVTVPAAACGAPPAVHEASLTSMGLIADIYTNSTMAALFKKD